MTRPICSACDGSGWTCTECGLPGTECDCIDSSNSVDCQDCQGTGEEDNDEDPADTWEEKRGER